MPPLSTVRVLAGCLAAVLLAPSQAPARDGGRPRVALVLSGGGARGAVHAGVLAALERMRVPIDLVVGTSMGALVGGLYCSGMRAEGIGLNLAGADWDDLFSGQVRRDFLSFTQKREETEFATTRDLGLKGGRVRMPQGLVADQKLQFLLRALTSGAPGGRDFDTLPVPFRAVATDLVSGEPVVLSRGDLAEAMRASMSVPGFFTPVEWEGKLLVDGGVTRNLPVDVALALGAEVIIAVEVPARKVDREELGTMVGVTARTLELLTDGNVAPQIASLRPQDILISPDPGSALGTEFDRSVEIAQAGEDAAWARSADLARLALSPREYREHLDARPSRPLLLDRPLAFVRVDGPPFMDEEVLSRPVRARPGQKLDLFSLREDLWRLYGTGDFELVTFSLQEEEGPEKGAGLVVKAREKGWGPDYLSFGLQAEDDFEGESLYQVSAAYTRTWLNRLGGEWKTRLTLGRTRSASTEFRQPLESAQALFVAPRLEYRSERLNLFSGPDRVAVYAVRTFDAGIDLGVDLGTAAEARVGVRRTRAQSDLKVGSPTLSEFTASRGGYRLSFALDTQDRPSFPHQGAAAELSLELMRRGLGSDVEYDKALARVGQALTWEKMTLQWGLELGSAEDTSVPFDDQFTLGGFLRLSGLRPRQLRGPYLGLGRILFYRQNGTLPSALGKGLYFGVSIEGGNVWQKREGMSGSDLRLAGSVFFGADLALGPLFLAYGHADSGEDATYLYLGKVY